MQQQDPGCKLKQTGARHTLTSGCPTCVSWSNSIPCPFDFLINDADKEWYLHYYKDHDAKEVGDFLAYGRARPI